MEEYDEKSRATLLTRLMVVGSGRRCQARSASPLHTLDPAYSTSTPSTDSGTERDDSDETETSENENQDEDPSISTRRRRARKRAGTTPDHLADLVATCKKAKTSMKGQKVPSDSEPTPGSPRQSASKTLNGKIGETCHSQAANLLEANK
jgi:hypothetical protein